VSLSHKLINKQIPYARAVWKMDSCHISSLVKVRRNKKTTNKHEFINNGGVTYQGHCIVWYRLMVCVVTPLVDPHSADHSKTYVTLR